jgi:hypothetical protein
MLEQSLKEAVPAELKSFAKLTMGHDPYFFDKWDEEAGASILRYWFWSKDKTERRKKRVFVGEIEELLKHLHAGQSFARDDFQKHCPRTNSDGPCGYAVIIRILEHFQEIQTISGDYRVKSAGKLRRLLS